MPGRAASSRPSCQLLTFMLSLSDDFPLDGNCPIPGRRARQISDQVQTARIILPRQMSGGRLTADLESKTPARKRRLENAGSKTPARKRRLEKSHQEISVLFFIRGLFGNPENLSQAIVTDKTCKRGGEETLTLYATCPVCTHVAS